MTKQGFTEPTLNECGADVSREWYVGFRHTCPTCQVRKHYPVRLGINYLKTAAERRAEGKAIIALLTEHLKSGWNPHHEKIEAYLQRIQREKEELEQETPKEVALADRPFNEAIAFALEEKRPHLANKSYGCFKTGLRFAQRAATALQLDVKPIREIRRMHIKEIMSQMVRDRQADYDKEGKGQEVTGNFYNKYKGYLLCILSELVEFEALEYNPATKIKERPAIKTNVHRHASKSEREMIKSTLQLKWPRFYDYLDTEYQTGIRPNEIFSIRICDIDWNSAYINLYPRDGGSKTRIARQVPIPDGLMKTLRKMKLESKPPTWFVFSKYFMPGPRRMPADYASKNWKDIVKDDLGLNVSLYSFKGLGGDDKRETGISLHAVSSQYGHTKMSTTMIYTHGEKERMEEELRRKTKPL
ncbi:MAG: site-specific integrase [Sphingobacteriales bacterium]|nr:MAG: site-specific integrase [Sphingobacteriales bacterium]